MKALQDYLDFELVKLITVDGEEFVGRPINVDYADENDTGEDEITLEFRDGKPHSFIGFTESEISNIEPIE